MKLKIKKKLKETGMSRYELAKRIGKTNQTAYNQVKAGLWESRTFKRGSMVGILVAYPKQ